MEAGNELGGTWSGNTELTINVVAVNVMSTYIYIYTNTLSIFYVAT